MRGLVALLIVANALLVAWWVFGPKPEVPAPAAPIAASPLVLLNEVPPAPVPTEPAEVAPAPAEPQDPAPGCQTLGPYLDRDVAMQTREQLVAAGLMVTPRAEDASQRLGYWVHTPASSAREDADAAVDRLLRAGIRDFYVVADGEFANAISLGVFSQRDSAVRHAERLQSLGFDVQVGERLRRLTSWWLDFPTPAPGSPAAARVIELALGGGDALTLTARACD